jgi:excisionase family DNA binding protein
MQAIRVNPPRPIRLEQSRSSADAAPLPTTGNLGAQPAPLMTPQEVSRILGITVGCLATWRCLRRYRLPYTRIGRLIRYRRQDLAQFIARGVEREP